MTTLLPGQNAPVKGDAMEVSVRTSGDAVVDVSAYLLDAGGKVRGDGDMVFYGQTSDASRSVSIAQSADRGAVVSFDLSRVPPAIERIAVCAAVDSGSSPGKTLSHAAPIEVLAAGCRFAPVPEPADITALTLVEVYRRAGVWKVRAVGQGFAGGLGPLSRMYGVEVAEEARAPAPPVPTVPRPSPVPAHPPVPAPLPQAAPPAVPSVSLSKVSLTKERPSVSLKKAGGSFGTVAVNLNWNRGAPARKGLFGGSRSGAVDLDLGCLFEMASGQKGAVQALGQQFGSLDDEPYVRLASDDRSGDASDGEWLHVAGAQWSKIRRLLIYAFIYEGVPNWASTNAVVSITLQGQAPIEVRLDEAHGYGMCAIALLENVGGDIRVGREIRYFKGHKEMDQAFGWGMNWRSGSK